MNIVVCVKQTPDTAATVTVDNGDVSWGDSPLVLNPWDEFAVEQALLTKEAHGGTVTVFSLGPEVATEALKQALAMGCDEAVLINDPSLAGADSLMVASALARAIKTIGDVELVFFGRESVDSATGVTFSQTARRLDWPVLSQVAGVEALDPDGRMITVERLLPEGRQLVKSELPAVVSVVKEINEPRYPSFMGIRKASKAEIPQWDAAKIGLTEGLEPHVAWPTLEEPPKVDTKCEFIEGETPEEKAQKLADRLVEEKIV
ncbi:MAG: electron transfer flavoprotein subunit beta/FixA family protein [Anaerolineales bacterium]